MTFQNAIVNFSYLCSKILHFSERQIKQVPAKMFQEGPFLTVYIRWLDCLMTSQNGSFRQDKNYPKSDHWVKLGKTASLMNHLLKNTS